MRDYANTDFRDRSLTAALARLLSHVRHRMTRSERRLGGVFRAYRGPDGNDYVAPAPAGAIPMSRRRWGKW